MRPVVAFLGHLDSPEAYAHALTELRGPDLPAPAPDKVARLVERLAPMPVCELEIRSARGIALPAVYIDAWLLLGGSPVAAARKVAQACAEAEASGARVAGLGGFTSILGEREGQGSAGTTAFTTGNTLTAAVIGAQVRADVPRGSRVVVVGAPGDVGSGLCRILIADGYRVVAVGRSPRHLAALAAELPVEVRTWEEAAPTAEAVVLVASARRGEIDLGQVPASSVILDAGHPLNAAGDHPGWAVAGRIVHERGPVGGIAAFLSHASGPGEHHACMAEAEILGFEGRFEPFSTGRGHIRPDRAAEILALAARHGVHPAPLRRRQVG